MGSRSVQRFKHEQFALAPPPRFMQKGLRSIAVCRNKYNGSTGRPGRSNQVSQESLTSRSGRCEVHQSDVLRPSSQQVIVLQAEADHRINKKDDASLPGQVQGSAIQAYRVIIADAPGNQQRAIAIAKWLSLKHRVECVA